MPRSGDVAIALALALAAIAAGYALYSEIGSSDAPRATSSNVVALRVANPFDASEIFEFPAGTSEADAHEAIAGFLIERAARRGATGAPRHDRHKS